MNTDAAGGREEEYLDEEDQEQEQEQEQTQERGARAARRDVEEDEDEEPELDEDEEEEEESDEEEILDDDMRRLQDAFPGFRRKYKLIKRIGEGLWAPMLARRPVVTSTLTNCFPLFQAHFPPSTRPKTCSTTATRTNGMSTRRTGRGPPLPSSGTSTAAAALLQPSTRPHSSHPTPLDSSARGHALSPSRRSTSHPLPRESSTSSSCFTTCATALPSAP